MRAGSDVAVPLISRAEAIGGARMSYAEARSSPCLSCDTSPCCRVLPLTTFDVRDLNGLDHAAYLLNFERIELGISKSGRWSAYFRQACRFLDTDNFGCTVHDTPAQPRLCVHYSPYGCWYESIYGPERSDQYLRVDRRRMEVVLDAVVFDEDRSIVAMPGWDELLAAFDELPIDDRDLVQATPPPPVLGQWQAVVLGTRPEAASVAAGTARRATDTVVSRPCEGCEATCCSTLVFPLPAPESMGNLDRWRFLLGFPGVEITAGDEGWAMAVKTRCRHLVAGRCGVFGRPERPLICSYYNELKCTYRTRFGTARPEGFVRITLEKLPWLLECIRFDDVGRVTATLPADAIRQHLERRMAEAAPAYATSNGRPAP
ncbi:MAG: hypothetical protein ACRDZW_02375 [Acidimicrobiales bacterium]